jgi:large subunit ribosomal protein L25
MAEFIKLPVAPRDVVGKANRRLGAEGPIPAVLYGPELDPISIALARHEFELLMVHEALGSTILEVKVEGKKDTVNVIVKEIQTNPVSGRVRHVDLLAVDLKKTIQTSVPIHFVGDAAGVKEGGILTHALLEVLIEALPTELPDALEADITELDVGDNLHVSDLVVPDGVTVLSDTDLTICSITLAKIVEEPEVEEEEEELEPGLIGEEGEEVEGEGAEEGEGPSEETAGEE